MELTEFTLRIILLFLPGIISFIIIDNLTIHKEIKVHQILIHSLLLGFLSYSFYYLTLQIINVCIAVDFGFAFSEILLNKDAKLDFAELAVVTGISVLVGFLFSFLINYKVLYRIAHSLKISRKFGDSDVWSYIMNSKASEWIIIRDNQLDLMYEGWIQAFSEGSEKDELFLRDVKVFVNSSGDELYEIPGLYLPRKRENLAIEFPLFEFSKFKERPKKGGE